MQAYLLTRQQVLRRSAFVLGTGSLVLGYFQYREQYIMKKLKVMSMQYQMLRRNPNHYHTLHEQVALSFSEQEQIQKEREAGILALRHELISQHAKGIVLETCVGHGMNMEFYQERAIKKLIGLDWTPSAVQKANQKAFNRSMMQVISCDIHKTPFSNESFDSVVDTFGLECCYDIERAFKEMKRITKRGGKILLLERGEGVWQSDRFETMRKAELNLGARGQIYHHDFAAMINQDQEVKIIKEKRKLRGMIYFYVLEKL